LFFNEIIIIQFLTLISLFLFSNTINILTLWYLSGIYLLSLGFLLLLDEGDIFIGFLWLIDLGVGLIFFIFILHFSSFLYQKANININLKFFFFFFLFTCFFIFFIYIILSPIDNNIYTYFKKVWFLLISWYDYYEFFLSTSITDLNLLREIYFYNNSLEFFILNFMLFYGILTSILLTFLIKKIFLLLSLNQLLNLNILNNININFFIRNQNFIKQQNTFAGTRIWLKKKKINL